MRQTIVYNNINHGDWVKCTDCGSQMLLPTGTDRCPECSSEDTLKWVKEDNTKHTIDVADVFYPDHLDKDVNIEECFKKKIK